MVQQAGQLDAGLSVEDKDADDQLFGSLERY